MLHYLRTGDIILYCIVLYYIMLCYVILYYTVLCYIVLYCIILYYVIVYNTILYYTANIWYAAAAAAAAAIVAAAATAAAPIKILHFDADSRVLPHEILDVFVSVVFLHVCLGVSSSKRRDSSFGVPLSSNGVFGYRPVKM